MYEVTSAYPAECAFQGIDYWGSQQSEYGDRLSMAFSGCQPDFQGRTNR